MWRRGHPGGCLHQKDRRLLTTLQTRHCLHTLFPWIILKPSKRYERMTETEGGMFQFKHDLQSIHSSLLCVEFFQGRQYFWKAMEHFAQMKLHPLSSKYRPTKTGAQPPAKLPWVLPARVREPSPWLSRAPATDHLHSIPPMLSATSATTGISPTRPPHLQGPMPVTLLGSAGVIWSGSSRGTETGALQFHHSRREKNVKPRLPLT